MRLRLFIGALIAGTLDIGSAAVINQAGIGVILHSIASGWYGPKASFSGGTHTEIAGLLFQWLIALISAGCYLVGTAIFPGLRRNWILGGLVAGTIVFGVMNYLVLPLSAIGHIAHFTPGKFIANLVAIWLYGLIIAFAARDA